MIFAARKQSVSSTRNWPKLVTFKEPKYRRSGVDGRNIVIEHRSAEGRPDRLPALVRELVELAVDVIVTGGSQTLLIARQATASIPIVTIGPNPVALGLADSLARPGGNVTGLSFSSGPSMWAKRLELLKRAAPAVKRIAFLSRSPVGG